jgi:N-glycosylase/DNA lyase
MPEPIKNLIGKYREKEKEIGKRLSEFSAKKGDEELYAELAFCMLTPQSKAKRCWAAIEELRERKLLLSDDIEGIASVLQKKVRFHNNKAGYIVGNRKIFLDDGKMKIRQKLSSFGNANELRAWLIANVKGYGWKEASHFMRNVGYGNEIAILDRHILRNLARYGVIKEVPKSLTPRKYVEIEDKMKKFCKKNNIPLAHLDLLFWSEETGEIFK